MAVDVETLARILEEDDRWLAEHYDEMIQKYPGKVVAIQNGEIVAIGADRVEVCRPFRESGAQPLPLIIDVPYPGELDNLLI
jgi:hypothetical protein